MKRIREAVWRRVEPYLLLLATLFAACDGYEQDAFEAAYVVEAYLVAGAPLPAVKLSRTAPIGTAYRFDDFAVTGATVAVALLDAGGAVERHYAYTPLAAGVYGPADPTGIVAPLRRYALTVTVPGAPPIRSETFVPGFFQVLGATADTVVYQGRDRFEVRITPSPYPGRPGIYIGTLLARDTTYGLSPFYAGLVADEGVDPGELVENPSGLLNEAFFERNADGSLTLRMPWVAVAFYGPTDVVVSALDDNLYDFERSRSDNGTRAPGEMDNLIDHVDGGTGIFGSLAPDTLRLFVRPPG